MAFAATGRVGLVLGSGAARGWAHIGVIRGLLAAGIVPDLVCGTSVGAIVGAAYAAGTLDAFESWVRSLDRTRVLRNLDPSFRGGLLKGAQFFEFMSHIMQVRITRSRMAGDPPELLITPDMADFALLDLDRGDEAIEEGRRATEWALAAASLGSGEAP
jgi:predicted acylesterase/phospholipase RssA